MLLYNRPGKVSNYLLGLIASRAISCESGCRFTVSGSHPRGEKKKNGSDLLEKPDPNALAIRDADPVKDFPDPTGK